MQDARGQNVARGPAQGYPSLLGKYDWDPGRWRPLHYMCEISVGVNAGQIGISSVTLNHQPYILTGLSGKIVGPTADPNSGLYQDYQWDVEWRDEQTNYTNGFIAADLMWGTPQSGSMKYLPLPVSYAGQRTLTFRVMNRVNRVLASQETLFKVQICLDGMSDWGTSKP